MLSGDIHFTGPTSDDVSAESEGPERTLDNPKSVIFGMKFSVRRIFLAAISR